MTSITKATLLNRRLPTRTHFVDVPPWGKLYLTEPSYTDYTRRHYAIQEGGPKAKERWAAYELIDWLTDENGSKLFSDPAELDDWTEREIAPLIGEIRKIEGSEAKNELAASDDTPPSSDETANSAQSLEYA